jgi:DNA-binding NarL/FixJ family response regulator
MAAIRVLIVDDVPQVRQDLRTLLPLVGDIRIVGEAADGTEAVRLAQALQPEVILMDLEMPVLDGYQAARQIKNRCPSRRVIALTIHDHATVRQKASEACVDDFIVKGSPLERLVEAILVTPPPP